VGRIEPQALVHRGKQRSHRRWTINDLSIGTRSRWPRQHVLLAPVAVRNVDGRFIKFVLARHAPR
jgi:hypothetical protein